MAVDLKALGLDGLTPAEKRRLADELVERANAEEPPGVPPRYELSDELRAELDRRLADSEANPDDHVPWEEVQASIRARLGR
jgi:putative addiction module component (TIGR02574 family)